MSDSTQPDARVELTVCDSPAPLGDGLRWTGAWRARVGILLRSLLFWTLWSALARALFYMWHWNVVPVADRIEVLRSFVFGIRMDLSAAAYLTALQWLILVVSVGIPAPTARRVLGGSAALAITFMSLVTLTDIGTFGPWRRRLDAGIWSYLATPREAYASAESIALGPLLGVLVVVLAASWWAYTRFVRRVEASLTQPRGLHALRAGAALAMSGVLLAIPIRGGVQWTPLNESTVAFSRSEIANLGAQNATWFLLYTTIADMEGPKSNPFVTMPAADARLVVDSLFRRSSDFSPILLTIAKPNVILIIWESLTAKVVTRLGGRRGVTPQFDRWVHQGIFFDSLFASGDRSAQGLVSILSGFPSIPREAIMTRPRKAATLPQLGASMRTAGYHTSYYYGGELAFANMKAYVLNGGFDRVTGVEAFRPEERNSKWGAHDHVVLGRALRELSIAERPFFSTVFTLSSHEPFEVPGAPVFAGRDESTLFLNAHHYTDASVGRFLDLASRQPWWDSTLVVIIADHGSPLPRPVDGTNESVPDRYHIPMLWLGGALRVRDTVVHRIAASVDLAPTLLRQLGVRPDGFRWGQNILQPGTGGFAYFAYHDGFAFIDGRGWMVYDERSRQRLEQSAGAGPEHQRSGSALLQASFADYLTR